MLLLYTLTCACGLVVYAYYTYIGCDPLRNGDITNENQVRSITLWFITETPLRVLGCTFDKKKSVG